MGSLAYAEPRLARVYDAANPPGAEEGHYLRLAGRERKAILDIGSGTGLFACKLAALGHDVVGAEPAEGMLSVARSRPGTETVKWVQSIAAELELDQRFDLITITGNVFQVFLTDDEILVVLKNLRSHLKPGGQLAFGTRNPLVREWEQWTPKLTREVLDVEGEGQVVIHYDIRSVAGELVTYETHFQFADDSAYVAPDTLRFVMKEQLAAFLSNAGFERVEWYGDWNGGPLSLASEEMIVIAKR